MKPSVRITSGRAESDGHSDHNNHNNNDDEGNDIMGIDYGHGSTNVSDVLLSGTATRVRYGVISQNELLQAWCDESEAYYGKPNCPECGNELDEATLECSDNHCNSCGCVFSDESAWGDEPLSHYVDDGEYQAESGSDGDIFITKSPYYAVCGFCSPCAPGAGYLTDTSEDCPAFCFHPDWFDGQCPHAVYRISDGQLVYRPDN